LDRGILFANGIAFGPDDALYATFTGEIDRYNVLGPANPQGEVFGNVLQPYEGDYFRGPDGMCWGVDGRLYCAVYGQRNVTVLNTDGSIAEPLPLDGRLRPFRKDSPRDRSRARPHRAACDALPRAAPL
jgi:gluconolactonase